jgi:hypothetical protein
MRPIFSANWRTAADVKSVHDHLSRHHAGRKSNGHVSTSVSVRTHTCPLGKTSNRRREPPLAASPLALQSDGLVLIISMALRDHASLVTLRHHNLVETIVISSSQRRTCATMLTLTSHYTATNAKHPRYARRSFARLATHCNRQGASGCEKRFAANSGVALGWVPGVRSVGCTTSARLGARRPLGWVHGVRSVGCTASARLGARRTSGPASFRPGCRHQVSQLSRRPCLSRDRVYLYPP